MSTKHTDTPRADELYIRLQDKNPFIVTDTLMEEYTKLERELNAAIRDRDNAISDHKQADTDSIRALHERNELRKGIAQLRAVADGLAACLNFRKSINATALLNDDDIKALSAYDALTKPEVDDHALVSKPLNAHEQPQPEQQQQEWGSRNDDGYIEDDGPRWGMYAEEGPPYTPAPLPSKTVGLTSEQSRLDQQLRPIVLAAMDRESAYELAKDALRYRMLSKMESLNLVIRAAYSERGEPYLDSLVVRQE